MVYCMVKLTNKIRQELIFDMAHGLSDEAAAERYGVTERQIRYYRQNYGVLIDKMKQANSSEEVQDSVPDNEPEIEDVEKQPESDEAPSYECAECGNSIEYLQQFCSECGVKLAWQKY